MIQNTIIARSMKILSKSDRKKIVLVVALQISFGFLDLLGVALVGVLGALAITGIKSSGPGNRVATLLEFLQLDDNTLQFQAATIGLLAAVLLIIKTVCSVIFLRKTVFFLSRRSAAISSQLISKVLAQPLIKVQEKSMQETLYMVTTGVQSITVGILNTAVLMLSDVSLLIILAVGLFLVDPLVALTAFLVFALVATSLYRLMQVRAWKLGNQERDISIRSSEKILEVFNSYREVIVRNRRGFYARELGKLRYQLADVTAELSFMPNISKYVIEITVVLGSLAIAALQFFINDAARAIAVLSVFLAASTRISPAILRLQQGAVQIKSQIGAAQPTLELIEKLSDSAAQTELSDTFDFEHKGFTGEISLRNITLSYPGSDSPAIKNLTLQITPGQVVSFVGPSGAGKTSIVDVILGVLEPDQGEVHLQNYSPLLAIQRWPGAIGYVPQDVMVSNGTIKENVCLGYDSKNISDNLVWSALEVAQLAEFVRELPSGLDTSVGDRGAKLSGGQRQRLGIARAMFTRPRLLVLDEATSSLDGSTEASISDAVHKLKGGVTIVMIAHRLSTVKESDVIYYIENGRLLDFGSFEHLRANVHEFDRQAQLMGM